MYIIEIVFYGVGIIQIVYWLYFLTGILRLRSSKPASPEPDIGVSIVVAANNELENLKKLIPSILNQNYESFELIIVNDRSTDGTLEYLHDLTKGENFKTLKVDHLPEHINGKKYAITLGIKAARFEQILLTDADCLPESEEWINSMASGFSGKKEIVLGFSNYEKKPGILNYFIRYETVLTGIQYLGAASMGHPYMGVGRNLAYTRDLFLRNKGFSGFQDVVGGDDDLFVNKYATGKNTASVVGQQAITLSTPKTTWSEYIRQKTRHLSVGKLYKSGSKMAISMFALSWIFTWILGGLLLIFNFQLGYPAYFLLVRVLLVILTFAIGIKKFGARFNVLGVIVLDILYSIYYILTGIRALFAKTIRWR